MQAFILPIFKSRKSRFKQTINKNFTPPDTVIFLDTNLYVVYFITNQQLVGGRRVRKFRYDWEIAPTTVGNRESGL